MVDTTVIDVSSEGTIAALREGESVVRLEYEGEYDECCGPKNGGWSAAVHCDC